MEDKDKKIECSECHKKFEKNNLYYCRDCSKEYCTDCVDDSNIYYCNCGYIVCDNCKCFKCQGEENIDFLI